MRFDILSNGTLITDDMAAFLSSTGRCNGVQVSIDGSIPTTHDVFRGKGNFKRAINGIKLLRKYNIPVPVRVTIHRQNVTDLDGIAALLLEEIGLPSFSTNSAIIFRPLPEKHGPGPAHCRRTFSRHEDTYNAQ